MRPTYVTLDKRAFIHNLKKVRKFAPGSGIVAALKANAYGHGIADLWEEAQFHVNMVGVACLEEALELREIGCSLPILLLEGFYGSEEIKFITKYKLTTVIHHQEQLKLLAKARLKEPIHVWLKLNSGMNRLGFNPQGFLAAWHTLKQNPHIIQPPVLMTHFACADNPQGELTRAQFALFNKTTAGLLGQRSLANSGAIIGFKETHAQWVRPGIMLYGISPFDNQTGLDLGLLPVMTLHSELIAIHQLSAGELIGYGATWRCPEAMRVGVVAVGYGDGYSRHSQSGTPVLVNGQIVPLIGRVSMDMITVDLRTQPHAKVGDPVILWGKGLPIERVAHAAGTIGYELVCRISKRVRHVVEK